MKRKQKFFEMKHLLDFDIFYIFNAFSDMRFDTVISLASNHNKRVLQ